VPSRNTSNGQLDNTLVFYILGDNGTSAKNWQTQRRFLILIAFFGAFPAIRLPVRLAFPVSAQ
jgi:hypothetical protein